MDVRQRSRRMFAACAVMVMMPAASPLFASGHGPLFGAATPTLGKGGWQFDEAWMGQVTNGADSNAQLLRSMISFGITEKIQVSASAPIPLTDTAPLPSGRMMSMMSFNRDLEVLGGWRFQTRPVGLGARFESTVYVGGTIPLTSHVADLNTAPAGYVALASGYASRSQYAWAGVSYQHPGERNGDRFGRVASVSVVYGYRPPAWRRDYPKPDLRFFVEATSDSTAPTLHAGSTMPNTGGRVTLVGPSLLLLYKAYGLEGGALFPIAQRVNGVQPGERVRFGVNFTYFFWPGSGKGHRS